MGFFQDVFSIFKKKDLVFMESRKEKENVYTFLFEKENDLIWKAGQHGLFSITHRSVKNGVRPFTIASAPAENVIKLTTRISEEPSEFKKALLELKEGMKVKMSGPVGSFYMKDSNPTLLIAGGIGITPYRSILKQIEAEGTIGEKPIHLLYLDSQKSYLYKDELDGLANHSAISITYLDSREDLHQEMDKFTDLYKDEGKYFIAGPKSMVDDLAAYLQNRNISKRNIKKDSFFGY